MAFNVNIKFLGWGAGFSDDVRTPVRQIPSIFTPDGSYVDLTKVVDGETVDLLGIYATNIYEALVGIQGNKGLDPLGSVTSKMGAFAIAVRSYLAAQAAGETDEGFTFAIDTYEDEIYWKQLAYAETIEGNFTITVTEDEEPSNP